MGSTDKSAKIQKVELQPQYYLYVNKNKHMILS